MTKIFACLALLLLTLSACYVSWKTPIADAPAPTESSISQSMAGGVGTQPANWREKR